jgi:hypothetical protein
MGSQLAGLYLAGIAVSWAWGRLEGLRSLLERRPAHGRDGLGSAVLAGAACACFAAWLYPAARQLYRYDQQDAAAISSQRKADATSGSDLAPLLAYVRRHGGGRVYAGLSGNWGNDFMVGAVPVYKYLLQENVDEMAYVVPSLSLMLVPEGEFAETVPADYGLFGVRYLILPTGEGPPVKANFVMARDVYSLWEVPSVHYVEPVSVEGRIVADRADVGAKSLGLLESLLPGRDASVDWSGSGRTGGGATTPEHGTGKAPVPVGKAPVPVGKAPVPVGKAPVPAGPPGKVLSVHANLERGTATAEVRMTRAGSLLLSASYVPGWHAWVDGRPRPVEMLAPALVGVRVPKGVHDVAFRYEGFAWYPELWAASLASLVGLWWVGRRAS